MTCFETLTARGPFAAIVCASSRAPSSALPSSTIVLTKPCFWPNSASYMLPVSAISIAIARCVRCGRIVTPPAAATRPRFTSGVPNFAVSAATTRSQASIVSKPPASA